MPLHFWTTVTHLGNSALLLPAALVLALWLVRTRHAPLALVWALSFGTAVLLVLASKLAFMGWGIGSAALDFTGISGHATVATAVFTMGAWLPLADRPRRLQLAGIAAGLSVGLLVGVSRVVLNAHSVSEVVAGFALGAAAAALPIGWAAGRTLRLRQRWVPMALAGVLSLLPQMGQPAETHGLVQKMALLASSRGEVYTRHMLHAPQRRP
ncbi:MAG: phosphatase PAP2 family protein [Pseudorhodoferax sp.]